MKRLKHRAKHELHPTKGYRKTTASWKHSRLLGGDHSGNAAMRIMLPFIHAKYGGYYHGKRV